jgi:hypothetical protein
MIYKSLIINTNAHSFLRNAKAKSYDKLVKTPEGLTKLIAYFEFWVDLQRAKNTTVNWNSLEFCWSHYAVLNSFTNKLKSNKSTLQQLSSTRNKTPGDSATGANKIPISRSQYSYKGPNSNSKDKMLKNNSVNTNPSFSKSSKLKESKTKISKRSLMSEIALIKDQFNHLISFTT